MDIYATRLPEDPVRQVQLENKLREYETRNEENCKLNADCLKKASPEQRAGILGVGIYKFLILQRMLRDGELNCHSFALEMMKKFVKLDIAFSITNFSRANMVIDDYVKTGGQNIKDGTGLPPPNIS